MRIAISGASGFIGTNLTHFLTLNGHQVVPLNRKDFSGSDEDLSAKLANCDGVINLAGTSIAIRWTKENKKMIMDSRVLVTRKLVSVINKMENKPEVFINASAIGYYQSNVENDEDSPTDNNSFLAEVVRKWEFEASEITPDVRLVILRFGVVLGADGGMLPRIMEIFSKKLNVTFGDQNKPFPWIYIKELEEIILLALENPSIKGIFNCVSPEATTIGRFNKVVGEHYKLYITIPIPAFVLKMVLGESAELMLDGKKVIPRHLQKIGYSFKYPKLEAVISDIINS